MKSTIKMNIYILSSWKNRQTVRLLACALRASGNHEVYDFTDPKSRNTEEIPPEKFPEQFDPAKHNYAEYISGNKYWYDAVMCNQRALDKCDLVILVLPCGNDAHADWAYAVGKGKFSIVIGQPPAGQRTPTHLWANDVLTDYDELLALVKKIQDYMDRGEALVIEHELSRSAGVLR